MKIFKLIYISFSHNLKNFHPKTKKILWHSDLSEFLKMFLFKEICILPSSSCFARIIHYQHAPGDTGEENVLSF